MSRLRSQAPPLVTESYINVLIALRATFTELAWTHQLPQLAHLIRREDVPHLPQRLPRPLTAEQDQLLQQDFLNRNDLGGNAFLLIRHTGMRIGECVDLSSACLRSTGPDQWAIHVPLGKLKTERNGAGGFVCSCGHSTLTILSLSRSAASRRSAPSPSELQGSPRSSTPRLPTPSLSFLGPLHTHRPAPVSPHLCHGDASRRRQLSRSDEITRPHFSRDDHALCRGGVG